MKSYSFLADVVVVVHALWAAFVTLGLLAILLGVLLRWKWVRNFWFRAVHLLMIGIVVFQALTGGCPLTSLENDLRTKAGESHYEGSFIGHWVHKLLFYRAPDWVFTTLYCAFGSLVLATFCLAPPRWPWAKSPSDGRPPDAPAAASQNSS
ncbi:MAG: DUF2784 domain-containing protein [Planctomycetota bacterium]|jgi:MFS superfamily sulfate permease-like transporter